MIPKNDQLVITSSNGTRFWVGSIMTGLLNEKAVSVGCYRVFLAELKNGYKEYALMLVENNQMTPVFSSQKAEDIACHLDIIELTKAEGDKE